MPPLFKSGTNFVVTDVVKRQIESAKPFAVAFRHAFYEHVHRLDWHKWDLTADAPEQYPTSGEPDDYYWDALPPRWWPRWLHRLSSGWIARGMPRCWEIVPPVKRCEVEWLGLDEFERFGCTHAVSFDGGEHEGVFYSSEKCLYVVADEAARGWLAGALGEWVHFWPLLRRG